MKKIIFLIMIILTTNSYADITSNLVGWWKLDEGTGSTTADSSGSGFTGTLQNSPTWIIGQIGPFALQFLGSSSQDVSMGDLSVLDNATKITLNCWMNRVSAGNIVACNGKNTATGASGISIQAYFDGNVYFNINSQSGSFAENTTGWHMWTIVYDGTQSTNATKVIAYEDGVAKTLSFSGTIDTALGATSTFFLGRSPQAFSTGDIDETRIYTRALSSSDVTQLFNYVPAAVLYTTKIGSAKINNARIGY